MLTKADIKKMCYARTYQKGLDLYRLNKVRTFDVVEDDYDYVQIEAQVQGSGRNVYDVSIVLHPDELELERKVEHFCECPAYDSYPGICKHCAAVLLEYLDYEAEQTSIMQNQIDLNSLEPMKGALAKKRKTTPVIQQLLKARAEERALPVVQNEVYGKVHIEPMLEVGYRSCLSFKLGVERMYVMKSITEFCECVDGKKYHSYGKQLAFTHTKDAFDEESMDILEFILEWWNSYRARYDRGYYGYYHMGNIREIEMTIATVERFLLLTKNQPFKAKILGETTDQWVVTDEVLPRQLEIRGTEQGIELELGYLSGYCGEKYWIYFIDGKIYMDPVSRVEEVKDFLHCMAQIPDRKVFIEKEDVPNFCRELLPQCKEVFECQIKNFEPEKYGVVPVEFEFYLDAPNPDLILCKAEAVYGEKRFSLYNKESVGTRDLTKEAVARSMVNSYGNAYDKEHLSMAVSGEDEIYRLLTEGVPQLQDIGQVFISDAIKSIQIKENPQVTVGVALKGDMLELSITAGEMSKEELIDILSKYQKKKKYYRLKNGDFVRMDEDGMAVLEEMREDMDLSYEEMKKKSVKVPKFRALYLDAQGKGGSLSLEKDKNFRSLIRHMKTAEDNDFDVPESLCKILRPYQKEGFLWLKTLKHNGFGGILADDMGLGKTLQVITFLLSEYETAEEMANLRTLIVAPASLVYNWAKEIERFAPQLSVSIITGKAEEREELIRQTGEREILLTSYDLLRRDVEVYSELSFFCQIIDEAQYIKNHNTKAARAVKKISSGFRVALTGTPVENQLSELWSIFDYLMPGFLYHYKKFREELEIPIVQNTDSRILERLQKMITPFVLRRLKKDVLKELPDKLEENVYAPLEGEQQKLYDARVQRLKLLLDKQSEEEFKTAKIEILSELTRLRQLCCDPSLVYEDYKENSSKLDMCLDLMENAISGGHKILLFSQFTSMLQTLQEHMEERGISFYTLTGSTNKEKRIRLVEQFNQDDTSVFCISLKAGGTGLNLTSADVVIHYDPWWNLAVQNQATDRAHRIGQKNVVTVYKLVMKGSIEENILRLQEKKKELADQILGGDQIGSASFSKEELLELLS
jgi:superfamily II DNA or RNA helicase